MPFLNKKGTAQHILATGLTNLVMFQIGQWNFEKSSILVTEISYVCIANFSTHVWKLQVWYLAHAQKVPLTLYYFD